jgi:hypothetical protein
MLPFQFGPIVVQVDGKMHPYWCVVVDADGIPAVIQLPSGSDPILILEEEAARRYTAHERSIIRVQLHPVTIHDIMEKLPAWVEP